jgi:hypothetical protein
MSELILYATEDGRSQVRAGKLEAAVAKESLSARSCAPCAEDGPGTIARATSEACPVVDEYRRQWA